MNVENMKLVRDAIKKGHPDVGFNMSSFADEDEECRTVACIAGWANLLSGDPDWKEMDDIHARKFLGLNDEQADQLFFPRLAGDRAFPWYAISKNHAIAVIDNLITTGKVDWSIKCP